MISEKTEKSLLQNLEDCCSNEWHSCELCAARQQAWARLQRHRRRLHQAWPEDLTAL